MPLKLDTEVSGIGKVLSSKWLAVPIHQRSFAWTVLEVAQLWDDIGRARLEEPDGYFIGPMVLADSRTGDKRFSVIDGQQRLATVSLIYAAMAAVLRAKGESDRAKIVEKIYLGEKVFSTLELEPKIRLGEHDDNYFRQLLQAAAHRQEAPIPETRKPSQELLRAAYVEVRRKLESEASAAGATLVERFDLIREYLEQRVQVIVVSVGSEENAFLIFETLNDRGLRLTVSDLLKNHLFSQAGERLDTVRSAWVEMRAALEAIDDDDATPMFLRHFWISTRAMVREKELYRIISAKIRGSAGAVELARGLARSAERYAALANPSHPAWQTSRIRSALEVLQLFRVVTPRPLLLAAHEVLSEEFEGVVAAVARWSVRLAIKGGLGSGTVEELYGEVARKIRKGNILRVRDLRRELNEVLPADEDFERSFSIKALRNQKQLRYLLRHLEIEERRRSGESSELTPTLDERTLSLEHVLPRRPDAGAWTGIGAEDRQLYVDRIGNTCLMLTNENRAAGASDFAAKREYYENSNLLLTRQLGAVQNWSAAEISKRQEKLAKLAVAAWPL